MNHNSGPAEDHPGSVIMHDGSDQHGVFQSESTLVNLTDDTSLMVLRIYRVTLSMMQYGTPEPQQFSTCTQGHTLTTKPQSRGFQRKF